jgi:Ca-activated chloride channel family protein
MYMKSKISAVSLLVIFFCGLWMPLRMGSAQEAEVPLFKRETHLINLTFSVRRPDGSLVTSLGQEDFQVSEDGVEQKIAFFDKESQIPLTLGLLVDVSDSQSKFFNRHRKDVEKFLKTVVGPKDEVFAMCFGNHLRITGEKSATKDDLLQGLESFDKGERNFPELAQDDPRDGGTALFDAVYYSVQQKLAQAEGRRRVLVLFTDGEENSSTHDQMEAIDAARESNTLIFAIHYKSGKERKAPHARQGEANLLHLAAESGGSEYDAMQMNVSKAFEQIASELKSLYSIAYHSTHNKRDGSFHRVVITTSDPELSVRARTGYYAR